jgi:hypothetical protein
MFPLKKEKSTADLCSRTHKSQYYSEFGFLLT